MLSIKTLSALLLSVSLLHPAIADPIPVPTAEALAYGKPLSTTPCPNVPRTSSFTAYGTVQTITTTAPAACPTSTLTKFAGACTRQVPPPDCIELQCIVELTTTVGCPGGCCPKKVPTATTTLPCTRTCRAGCATSTATETVACKK